MSACQWHTPHLNVFARCRRKYHTISKIIPNDLYPAKATSHELFTRFTLCCVLLCLVDSRFLQYHSGVQNGAIISGHFSPKSSQETPSDKYTKLGSINYFTMFSLFNGELEATSMFKGGKLSSVTRSKIYSCVRLIVFNLPFQIPAPTWWIWYWIFCHNAWKSLQSYQKLTIPRRNKNLTLRPILNISRLFLQLPLPNPLKPGVKSRMKMYSEQRGQAMLQLHMSDQQFYCLLKCDLEVWLTGKFLFSKWKVKDIVRPVQETKQGKFVCYKYLLRNTTSAGE